MPRSNLTFVAPQWLACCGCALLLLCFPLAVIAMVLQQSLALVPVLVVSAYLASQVLDRLAPTSRRRRSTFEIASAGWLQSRQST